jgi:hypothetical protein
MTRLGALVLGAVAAAASPAAAEPDPDPPVDPLADPIEAVTAIRLDRAELDRRPHAQTTELLRELPGAALIQPAAAGGRASDWLVRGLAAGPGTGLAITVDGVPVNQTAHAYIHGYADLGFVIPETVAAAVLHAGTYLARQGEHATAGTLELTTVTAVPRGGAYVGLGTGLQLSGPIVQHRLRRRWFRVVGMTSPELPRGDTLIAAELGIADGPYLHPQRLRRGNLLGKWSLPLGERGRLTTAATFYSARWAESGELPASEIAALRLDPLGAADPSQGGVASRAGASVAIDHAGWRLTAYAIRSELALYRNPTLFLVDEDAGDAREYDDRRTTFGLDTAYRRAHRVWRWPAVLELGAQAQTDGVTGEVWHVERRRRLAGCTETTANPCTRMTIRADHVAAYAAEQLALHPRLIVRAALRLDQFVWDIGGDPGRLAGAQAGARIVPRFAAAFAVSPHLDVVAQAGAGVQSTDARAAVDASGYAALTRTWSGEVGARVRAGGVRAAASAWLARDSDGRTWLADEGRSIAYPGVRRFGAEARATVEPTAWLALDASLAVARATRRNDDEPVPLAPRLVGSGGAAVHGASWLASIRIRGLGARPVGLGADDRMAQAVAIVDLTAAWRWRGLELELTVENLFDRTWRASERTGAVRPYRGAEVVDDLLVTPGIPLTAMVTLGYSLGGSRPR